MSDVKPIFFEQYYKFDGDVPDHDELTGSVCAEDGTYMLFDAIQPDIDPKFLALNIPSLGLLNTLAEARMAKVEQLVRQGFRVNNLYVRFPDGLVERVYEGVRSSNYTQPGPHNSGLLD